VFVRLKYSERNSTESLLDRELFEHRKMEIYRFPDPGPGVRRIAYLTMGCPVELGTVPGTRKASGLK